MKKSRFTESQIVSILKTEPAVGPSDQPRLCLIDKGSIHRMQYRAYP